MIGATNNLSLGAIVSALAGRSLRFSAPVPLNAAAVAAHAALTETNHQLNAELDAIEQQVRSVQQRRQEASAACITAIRAAHPEIGEREFLVRCSTTDHSNASYQVELQAEEVRPPPEWVDDLRRKFEGGEAGLRG